MRELESALGHAFRSPALLTCALTHRSLARQIAHETGDGGPAGSAEAAVPEDNERLEFLGDAVLSLVVAEALFEMHPEWHEGELTRVRAQLVSRQHMARVAEAIGLGRHLRLSKGEERSGLRHKSTLLSNSMEAVLGALFLDAGLEPVRVFARRQVIGEAVNQLAEQLRSGAALGNYKSALQERLHAARTGTPVYRVKSESGPAHRRRFLVEVRIKDGSGAGSGAGAGAGPGDGSGDGTGGAGEPLARGSGGTKKDAEQDAARRALELLDAGETNLRGAAALETDQEEPAAP